MKLFFSLFYIKKHHVYALLLVSALFFLGNGQFDLFDNSETHYTRVTQEMVQSGDWLNLSYNGKPWYVHPPLYFWTTSLITHIFGWSTEVLRFQGSLFTTGCVFMTYLIPSLFLSPAIALGSAIIFGTSLYISMIGKLAIFDAHLYFFMLLSLFIILQHIHNKILPKFFILFAGLATGLGVLAKGPISLVQQLIFLVPYLIYLKQWHHFRSAWVWATILISIAIPAPWYAHQLIHHGQPFFDLALRDYTWYRFFGVVENQSGPWHYYFTVLLAFFPWICWLPQLIVTHFKTGILAVQSKETQGLVFSWIAAITTFLFFSAAQTKLPNYIYLMFPFLAILTSHWLHQLKQFNAALIVLLSFLCIIIGTGFNLSIYDLKPGHQTLINLTFIMLCVPALSFFIGRYLKKRINWSLMMFTALSFIPMFWLTYVILPEVSSYDPVKKAASIILEDATQDDYVMVHYYGITPSTLVRLNKHVLQLRSDADLVDVINSNSIVYVLSHEKYIHDDIKGMSQLEQLWYLDDHLVLKFKHDIN